MIYSLILGFSFSALIAWVAYRKQSLSKSGSIAAIFIGTNIYAFGSLFWYGLLLAFFISSSALSQWKKRQKEEATRDRFAKTGSRDGKQVLANGGIGAALVWFGRAANDPLPWMAAYVGVMAAVNADTWGTELGTLAKGKPRHIITGRPVEKGTSGGISLRGTVGTALGGLWIGLFATVFQWFETSNWHASWIWIGLVSGLFGALFDSLLGATTQALYRCSVCEAETEKETHCGKKTRRSRGYPWCDNDAVNFLSSAFGGALALCCWLFAA